MPATYAASAELATPQSAIARDLDREHGSLHTADYERTGQQIGILPIDAQIARSWRFSTLATAQQLAGFTWMASQVIKLT
jgi:hypothetical protein